MCDLQAAVASSHFRFIADNSEREQNDRRRLSKLPRIHTSTLAARVPETMFSLIALLMLNSHWCGCRPMYYYDILHPYIDTSTVT